MKRPQDVPAIAAPKGNAKAKLVKVSPVREAHQYEPVSNSMVRLYGAAVWATVLLSVLSFNVSAAEHPYRELLDDAFPTASAPVPLSTGMFHWRGLENLPAGTKIEWDAESIQWSRIDDRIVLPRARIRIEIPGVDGAHLVSVERATPLRKSTKGSWYGDILSPLVSGGASTLAVRYRKGSAEQEVILTLERDSAAGARFIAIDSSCSALQVEIVPIRSVPYRSSVLADCRIIRGITADRMLPSLDLLLFVDGADEVLKVNGVALRSEAPSLFRLRLFSQNQPITLETPNGDTYELRVKIPTKLNRGFVGIGGGPYRYHLDAPATGVDTTAAVLTVYGSYQVSESVRYTVFNATAIHKNFFTDTGFYVKSDSARFFDRRVTFSLMLGANFIGYRYGAETQKKWGAPQGFEAAYHDFLTLNRTLVFGAFLYPPIEGKSYYNTWLRYGSPAIFGEINYLSIRDTFDGQPVFVRSVGISVGFPLARFF